MPEIPQIPPRTRTVFRILALAAWAVSLPGQIDTGLIVGSVADPSGAAVPEAGIVLRSGSTGVRFRSQTNDAGRFQSPPLRPDSYEVYVRKAGFKTGTATVTLAVQQRAELNFVLEVGDVAQEVTVDAAAARLETESSAMANLRGSKAVSDLPLNSRNFAFLVGLAPGTVASFTQTTTPLNATIKRGVTNYAVNGVRPTNEYNAMLVEGIENSENHNGFGVAIFPPPEAIQEFKVQTSTADAQFGRAAGAFVNVVMKSGSKDFQGLLYHFLRNSAMDARNFFDNPSTKKPNFALNQFGVTLGGPVLLPGGYNRNRDKTFFFFSGAGDIRRQAATFVTTVPTAAMRQGDFSGHPNQVFDPLTLAAGARTQFPGNRIPASRLNAVGSRAVALYPGTNRPGIVNNYIGSPSRTYDASQLDFKADHYVNDVHSVSFRGSVGDANVFDPGVLPAPAGGGPSSGLAGTFDTPARQFALSARSTLRPDLLNEVRGGFTRVNLRLINLNYGRDISQELGIPNANTGSPLTSGLSVLNPSGFTPLGDANFTPSVVVSNNFQLEDNLYWIRGNHSLRMGARYDRRQYNTFQTTAPRGNMAFTGVYTTNPARPNGTGIGMADLLLGAPISGTIQTLDGTRGLRRTELGFYFQDDWKIARDVTLNLGVRYEYYPTYPWIEVADRMSQFLPATGEVVRVGTGGVPRSGTKADSNNLAPRAGLAWRMGGSTVLRVGYGVYFVAPLYNIIQNLATNAPFAGSSAFNNNQLDFTGARRIDQGFIRATPDARGSVVYALDPRFTNPYMQQWNVNLQHQLTQTMVFSAAYVGSKGTSLLQRPNLNQARPGPGAVANRRPYPQYNDIELHTGIGNSIYNALQATLEKRFSSGLNFSVAYTWGHVIDYGMTYQDVWNYRADRGNADFDVRHSFIWNGSYALPFGGGQTGALGALARDWQVNGVLRLSTGVPFTPNSSINTLNGSGAQRADVVPGCNPRLDNPTPERWFNTSCFAVPAQFQFGNAGRNILTGPGTRSADVSVFREFYYRGRDDKRRRLQFRLEAFNVTNSPQFNNPNPSIGAVQAGVISSAGSQPSFQRTQRQVQAALKLFW